MKQKFDFLSLDNSVITDTSLDTSGNLQASDEVFEDNNANGKENKERSIPSENDGPETEKEAKTLYFTDSILANDCSSMTIDNNITDNEDVYIEREEQPNPKLHTYTITADVSADNKYDKIFHHQCLINNEKIKVDVQTNSDNEEFSLTKEPEKRISSPLISESTVYQNPNASPIPYQVEISKNIKITGNYEITIVCSKEATLKLYSSDGRLIVSNKNTLSLPKKWLYAGNYTIIAESTSPIKQSDISEQFDLIADDKEISNFSELRDELINNLIEYTNGDTYKLKDFNGTDWKSSKKYTLHGGWSDVSISVNSVASNRYSIQFQGKAKVQVLGIVFNADLSNDKYLKVYWNSSTKQFEENFDLKGSFSVRVESEDRRKNLNLGGFSFKNVEFTLNVDTVAEEYSFKTEVALRRSRGAQTSLSAEASIKKDIYSVHVWIDGTKNIAIGGNMYLQTFSVKATWDASNENSKQVYSGTMSISYGKVVPLNFKYTMDDFEVFNFQGSFTLGLLDFKEVTYSTDGAFYGNATIDILKLGKYSLLHGEVEAAIASNGDYTFSGSLDINLGITVTGECIINGIGSRMTIASSAEIKTWKIFGNKSLASAKIFIVSDTGNQSDFTITVYGRVGSTEVGYHWDLVNKLYSCINGEIAEEEWKKIEEDHGNIVEETKYNIKSTFTSGYAEYFVETKEDFAFKLIINSPDGQTYVYNSTSAKIKTNEVDDPLCKIERLTNGYSFIFDGAIAGEWTFKLIGEKDVMNSVSTSFVYNRNITVTPSLDVAEFDNTAITFNYSAASDQADPIVFLMFDNDSSGYDGQCIAVLSENQNGTYTWQVPDNYENQTPYFYLMIQGEGIQTSYSDYTSGISISQKNADIYVKDLLLTQNCYSANDQYYLSFTLGNSGSEGVDDFYSEIIISEDREYDGTDTIVGSYWQESLGGNEEYRDTQAFIVPENYVGKTFYIGIVADSNCDIEDDYNSNNNISWITVTPDTPIQSSNYGQIFTSSTWNQRAPWNNYVPYPTENATSRALLGCGTVAVAQVLYTLKAPKSLSFDASDRYTYNGISIDSDHETLSFPSFDELNQMVANIKYDGSESDMAALGFAVSIKLAAEFGANNTTTYKSAYKPFFIDDCNFDSTTVWDSSGKKNSDGSWKQEYIDVIADNVKSGSPVILGLKNRNSSVGHLTFIEDYDESSNLFYVNLGWGGSSDGWYSLDKIAEDYYTNDVFLDIIPEYDGSAIVVNSTADYGVGTLRRAIELANSIKGTNTIVFDSCLAGQTIDLDSRLSITEQVNIIGLESGNVTISRDFNDYALYFQSGAAGSTISGITIDGDDKSSYLIYNACTDNVFSNITLQNYSGSYAIYASSKSYAVKMDSDCNLNGYSSNRAITYIPDKVSDTEATLTDRGILFSWGKATDIEDGEVSLYKLEYSLKEDFSDLLSITVSGWTYLLDEIQNGINYFWRICGIDSNGNSGIYSEIKRIFIGTDNDAPTVVSGLTADVDDIRATLTWDEASDSSSGVSHYILEYSEKMDFSEKVIITTENTTYKLQGLKNNATYYWRVASVDKEGNTSNYSQVCEFTPSTDSLIISDIRNTTIATDRKLHILATGACKVDGKDNTSDTYLVKVTGYETELYLSGEISLINGKGAYGIYGNNIIGGNVGGTISLNCQYEIPEDGNAKYVFGIRASNLKLSDFSSALNIISNSGINGYGIYASDAFIKINNFSGNISITTEKIACGMQTGREFFIGNLEETASIKIISLKEKAYGISTYFYDYQGYGLNSSIDINELNGCISVKSMTSYAYGIYSYTYNESSSTISGDICIKDWTGCVHVSSQASSAYAMGVCTNPYLHENATGSISGKIDIKNMSGSLIVNSTSVAYGFYASGKSNIEISDFSGVIMVSSEERFACGLYSNEQLSGFFSGTIIVNSLDAGNAFSSFGGLSVSVSGTVLSSCFSEEGKSYAETATLLNSYADNLQITKDKILSLDRGYAFYSYGRIDDNISICDNAFVVGDVYLQSGSDKITLDTTAELVGDISVNGKLDLTFAFTGITDTATLTTTNISTLKSDKSTVNIDIKSNLSGKQILARTTQQYSSWGQKTINVKIGNNISTLTVDGDAVTVGDYTISLKWENSTDLVMYTSIKPSNPQVSVQKLTWLATSTCTVEYSTDNFEHVLRVQTDNNSLDFWQLPQEKFSWRVSISGGNEWIYGEDINNLNATLTEPQLIKSMPDNNLDLFFANTNDKWSANYTAKHIGVLNSWDGTNEEVTLTGKNKLADIFEGSTDANILVMTDDANGDALFVDDIYTVLPGTVEEQQARIALIDEIRAGLGDDIVDMTSQRFAYIGDSVKIYGGLGDDTIWANNGSNTLFGDAGNDRLVGGANNDVIVGGSGNDSMHGGGGEDIFCFGENWGKDTVEQLTGSKVTLWFESGSKENWNASTLTYTDETNSVKVKGISANNIILVFGNDSSSLYNELASAGCFNDAVSEKIFEDKNKGMLA